MSDNIWEELSRSPLDPDPNEKPSMHGWLIPAALAVAAGLVLGFAVGNGPSGATPSTSTTVDVTSADSTAAPVLPDPIVPAGYTPTGTFGLRAIATYSQGGNLYVSVDQVVRSDNDPMETDAMYLAEWILSGDGIEVVASRALDSAASPGVKLVEFPGVSRLPGSAPQLIVREATEMTVRTGCHGCGAFSQDTATGEIVLEGVDRPYALAEPLLVSVGEAITISIDRLDITDDWGYLEWHAIDANGAIVRLMPIVTFAGTDDPGVDGEQPTQLVPPQLFGISQQRPSTMNPGIFSRGGAIGLDHRGELLSDQNQPSSLVLEWTAEWQHPVGQPISIPLVDITDLGIID